MLPFGDEEEEDDANGDLVSLTVLTAALGAAAVVGVVTGLIVESTAVSVADAAAADADILLDSVDVVGPESESEFHVVGEFSTFGSMLKFGLFRLPP